MATQSLLLCRDPEVLGVLQPTLGEMGFNPQVCALRDSALELLREHKFDAVIVDCDQLDAEGEVLKMLRQTEINHDSIALGIIADDRQVRGVFASGANLVLRKPLRAEDTNRTLRTARSLATRMRRHFLRCVLHTLAFIRLDGVDEDMMILDVSEGGLAVQALDPLEPRRAFAVHFSLPGEREEFEAVAAVAWSDSSARSGLRFLGMPAAARDRLRAWLDRNGGDGAVEIPPEDDPDSASVQFPLQLSPAAHGVCAAILDVAIVVSAVAAFAGITYMLAGQLALMGANVSAALLLLCVCWLLYRYVFFASVSMTPGGHLTAAISDRCLAWHYNRRLVAERLA